MDLFKLTSFSESLKKALAVQETIHFQLHQEASSAGGSFAAPNKYSI